MSAQPKTTIHQEEFNVDKSIVKHLILSQSGTLDKAIMELIMNSIDGGSKSVEVLINASMTQISVIDSGIGFTSVDQIKKNFGNFGFDHETQEELAKHRRYGTFGLGRGQAMAFGRCMWTSNAFRMTVDLKSKGKEKDAPYVIEELGDIAHKGCRVDIELYEPMRMWEYNNLQRNLKNNLKYCPCPIVINGQQVTLNIKDVKWTENTGKLAFKRASSDSMSGLNVYNDGVYVCNFSHSRLGVSGDVTSVDCTFDLNMARNDILVSQCELYPELKDICKKYSEKKSNRMTKEDAQYFLASWFAGEIATGDISTKSVLTNIKGRRTRLSSLFNHAGGTITVAKENEKGVGERVHEEKLAYVIPQHVLDDLQCESLDEFCQRIKEIVKSEYNHQHDWQYDRSVRGLLDLKAVEFDTLGSEFQGENQLIPKDKVSKLERCRLHALASVQNQLTYHINLALGFASYGNTDRIHARKLTLGKSETALAWTDGNSMIAIEKKYMSECFNKGMNGILEMINTLIHEYCHNEKLDNGHSHSREFMDMYHDITGSTEIKFFNIAMNIFREVIRLRKKEGLSISNSEISFVSEIDSLRGAINGAES